MLDNYFKKINTYDTGPTLNIWTWNINSVRTKVDLVNKLLLKHDIDILLLTETKIQQENIKFNNYNCIWNNNKNSYHHGIAFVYKQDLNIELLSNTLSIYEKNINIKNLKNKEVIEKYQPFIDKEIEKAYHNEGRILTIKCNNIIIVGTYVPNSGRDKQEPLKRLAFRTLCWDIDLYTYLLELEKQYPVIWIGDLNVVRCDNDALNINYNIAGITPEERENMNHFMTNLWIDVWDKCNPNVKKTKDRATWLGDNLKSRFPLRLDYIICSKSLEKSIISSKHDQLYAGSDHIPIGASFKI
jgi:exodeoxyribonuclease-3